MYVLSRAIGHKISFRRTDNEDGGGARTLAKDKARSVGVVREDRRRQLLGKFAVGRKKSTSSPRLVESDEGGEEEALPAVSLPLPPSATPATAAAPSSTSSSGAAAAHVITQAAAVSDLPPSSEGAVERTSDEPNGGVVAVEETAERPRVGKLRKVFRLLPKRRSRSPTAGAAGSASATGSGNGNVDRDGSPSSNADRSPAVSPRPVRAVAALTRSLSSGPQLEGATISPRLATLAATEKPPRQNIAQGERESLHGSTHSLHVPATLSPRVRAASTSALLRSASVDDAGQDPVRPSSSDSSGKDTPRPRHYSLEDYV